MAARGLQWVYPPLVGYQEVEAWAAKGHVSPPYMSRTPEIRHADILEDDLLIFATDGLRDALPLELQADDWDIILGLLHGSADPRLGHQCVSSSNVADGLVQNVLFGSDEEKMKEVINGPAYRDDISVVVVKFVGSNKPMHRHCCRTDIIASTRDNTILQPDERSLTLLMSTLLSVEFFSALRW